MADGGQHQKQDSINKRMSPETHNE